MFTADQLVCHLIGDYILQSDWMATNKTKRFFAAWAHSIAYHVPFLLLRPTPAALAVMLWSHFLIDRYRLARYVVWLKNWMGPNRPWEECFATGYPADRPQYLSVWLLIIADNILHICINGAALRWL